MSLYIIMHKHVYKYLISQLYGLSITYIIRMSCTSRKYVIGSNCNITYLVKISRKKYIDIKHEISTHPFRIHAYLIYMIVART